MVGAAGQVSRPSGVRALGGCWSQQPLKRQWGASDQGAGSGLGHGAPSRALTAEAVLVVPEGGLPEEQGLWEAEGVREKREAAGMNEAEKQPE